MTTTSIQRAAPDIHAVDSWLPEPAAIVSACRDLLSAGEPSDALEVIHTLGVPASDLCITPLGLAAAKLGAQVGTAFFHHELRVRLPMPKHLEPELAVWGEGTVPVWKDGILGEPKYFSFFQDAPFIAFNPNHRRKWPAHELVHGAVGFFWRPDMTRFECYLGSRINELLPVVHWHGFDDMFRPQCPEHLGKPLYDSFCARCEAMSDPYWQLSPAAIEALEPAAHAHAEHGVDHLKREWQACLRELDIGRPQVTPLGKLDASSDARGYLKGHWNRLTAWSFGTWMELFCIDGVDYESTTEGLLGRVAGVAQSLTTGARALDLSSVGTMRARRMLQDLGYRCLMALESLDESSAAAEQAESALMPAIEAAAQLSHRLLDATPGSDQLESVVPVLSELHERVLASRPWLGDELTNAVGALGYQWVDVGFGRDAEVSQLQEGMVSLGVSEGLLPALVSRAVDLYESDSMEARGSLCQRMATSVDGEDDALYELLQFEAFLRAEPKMDRDAEDFGVLAEGVDELWRQGGRLRLNQTLTRHWFSVAFIREQLGEDAVPDDHRGAQAELIRGWFMGEPRLLVIEPGLQRLLSAIGQGCRVDELEREHGETLMSMMQHGCVVWSPSPRRELPDGAPDPVSSRQDT